MQRALLVAGVAMLVASIAASAQVTQSGNGKIKPKLVPTIPSLSAGAPQPATATNARLLTPANKWDVRTVAARSGGRTGTAQILHLRGLEGIQKAQGLPDGARRLLAMHVQTLRPGDPNHYMVNTQLAEEWIRAHPVPADIKPRDSGSDSHAGCHALSVHCAEEAAQHAGGQVSQEWQKAWEQATADWKHASDELTKDWNAVEGCFADHTLPALHVPIRDSIAPTMTVGLETSGSKSVGGGTASGSVKGTLGLGFPMVSDFQTTIEVFYIPCLPFVVRPKSIAGSGTMAVGERITTVLSAAGAFDRQFTIPPTGGPQIPIEVIPIMIGDVPIAELDVSAYIEGNVEVGARGRADARFQLDNPHKANFTFTCSGSGCSASSRPIPDPTTMTESAQIQGQVFVRPAVFTALQLDFDVDALTARAGPEPYLLGTASGCGAVTASQTVGGSSTSAENSLLAADLDWGVNLRAEALVARQVVGKPYIDSLTGNKHLWFRDLAPGGSTALIVAANGPTQAVVAKQAAYKVRMPSCYPYPNAVKYHVSWTGNATAAANAACRWQSNGGDCTFDPTKDLAFGLTWSTAGSYAVSVVATGDDHHRVFAPAPKSTQVAVTVSTAGGGAP